MPNFGTIISGAGISGLYQLYRLREMGQGVRRFEAGTGGVNQNVDGYREPELA